MKDKYNTELYHYGILGMKWGVRRTPAQLGHIVSAGHKKLKNVIDENKQKKANKKAEEEHMSMPSVKKTRKMSDSDIKEKIERLKLEKENKQLLNDTRNESQNRGKQFIASILETSGKNILTQLSAYGMGTLVNKIFEKKVGEKVVDPKNIQKKK